MIRKNAGSKRWAQVEKINAAITDWKNRIMPAILHATARANAIIRDAQLRLTSSTSSSHVIQFGRLGPPVPSLPVLIVAAQRGPTPKATLASQLAGAQRQPKASIQDFSRSPSIQFGVRADGKIAIAPQNYSSKFQGATEASEFEETTAEAAIADLIETIVSKNE
jgi:hypothetical protein